MTAYDPTTASRLIAGARAARPAISATRSIAMAMMIERLNAMADQLEAATVEVVRSRDASDDCARDRCINVLTEYARLLGIGERAIEQWRHRSDPLSPMSLAMLAAPVAERDKANSESEQLRCHDCDLPLATQADWHGTPEDEGADLCWRAWANDVCCRVPVDWRARALAAEGIVVRLEASLRDIDMGAFAGVQTAVASRDESGDMRRAIFWSIRDLVRAALALRQA